MKTDTEHKQNFKEVWHHYFRKEDIFLIPNLLCYFRIALIAVFLVFYFHPITILGNQYANIYLAVGVIAIAAYTDFIDGFVARTYDRKSPLGSVVDPRADKLLQAAIACALVAKLYKFAAVDTRLAVFLIKEFTLMGQDIHRARKKQSFGKAQWYGKVSTFVFYLRLGVLLFAGPMLANSSLYQQHQVIDSLATVAILFLALALIGYIHLEYKILKKSKISSKGENNDQNL